MGEDDVRKILKEYLEDLCNVNTEEWVTVNICSFGGAGRRNYFVGERKVELKWKWEGKISRMAW